MKVYVPIFDMRDDPPSRKWWICNEGSKIHKLWLDNDRKLIKLIDIKEPEEK